MLRNIVATIILLGLDFTWLALYMTPRYKALVKSIQGSALKANMTSALASYTLMVVALNMFVINYNFSNLEAFVFGVCLYGVYDFTNGAIFKNWDFKLAYIDVLWGGLVYFLAAYVSKFIVRKR